MAFKCNFSMTYDDPTWEYIVDSCDNTATHLIRWHDVRHPNRNRICLCTEHHATVLEDITHDADAFAISDKELI